MADQSMHSMDIALQMTVKAMAAPKPEPYSDEEQSVCRSCQEMARNSDGEFFDDMFLCRDCRNDGDALYIALRDMADRDRIDRCYYEKLQRVVGEIHKLAGDAAEKG